MYLTTDITSFCKKGHIYGRKGDLVTIVKDSDHLPKVKGPDGELFHVAKSELSETPVAGNEQKDIVTPVQTPVTQTPITNPQPAKIKTPAAQTSLF